MTYPSTVDGLEVIIGGGVHAAVYAATRVAIGMPPPVVLEANLSFGGVFSRLKPFTLNSANEASLRSIESGPTRIPALSDTESINYLPNCPYQIPENGEYPTSNAVAEVIAQNIRTVANGYVDAPAYVATDGYLCRDRELAMPIPGTPKRVIVATGLAMTKTYESNNAVNAEEFLRMPYLSGNQNVAIVGGGDTACICVERLLGMNPNDYGIQKPRNIDWYGGYTLPVTKKTWARDYHARYIALARHLPQNGTTGVIRPVGASGTIETAGNLVMVNNRPYDFVIDATGYKPVTSVAPYALALYNGGGRALARWDRDYSGKVFRVGPGVLGDYTPITPFPSRFPAARDAIFRLAPLTAALAADLQ
jgi:hypothetical protein